MAKHAHAAHRIGGHESALEVKRAPRTLLLGALALAALATVLGTLLLWPDGEAADEVRGSLSFAAPGVTFPQAVVDRVEPRCPPILEGVPDEGADQEGCGKLHVTVDEGVDAGTELAVQVPPEVSAAGLIPGDRVELIRTPSAEGEPAQLNYFDIVREIPLRTLAIIFAAVVLAVAWLRGLMALVGLAFAAVVLWQFMIPALLTGESAVAVALTAASAILFVVLYTTHGFSLRTSVALAGTLVGVGITALLGWWSVDSSRLTGASGEEGGIMGTYVSAVSLQGVFTAAVIIAGLGVLNDVTITQASAAWELRVASPEMSRTKLFTSAMRIGRDHIASSIYTIVFAYAGTALTVLLVVSMFDRPLLDLVGTEEIAEEVVRSLVSSIGLVLAVPITTALAALIVPGPVRPDHGTGEWTGG
jgi:uncharacterized membrane protein